MGKIKNKIVNENILYDESLSFMSLVESAWRVLGLVLLHSFKYRELMTIRLVRRALGFTTLLWVRGAKHDALYDTTIPTEIKSAVVTTKEGNLKLNFKFQFDKVHEEGRLEEIREHMHHLILAGFDGPAPNPEFVIVIKNKAVIEEITWGLLVEEQKRIREKKKLHPRNRDAASMTSHYLFNILSLVTEDIIIIDKEANIITNTEFLVKFNAGLVDNARAA